MSLEVGRPEVDALDALLPTDRVKDIQSEVDLRFVHSDEIESTTDAQHCEPLLGDRLLPYEVEDVIGPLRKQITDGLYRKTPAHATSDLESELARVTGLKQTRGTEEWRKSPP